MVKLYATDYQLAGYELVEWRREIIRPQSRLSRPPVSARDSFPRPRHSRKKCCRSSTSRSFSTASKRPSHPASRTSSSSPAAARTRSKIISTSTSSSKASSSSAARLDLLEEIRKISNMINVAYVRQGEPLGLGHAVLVTADLVGDEPFAVILADDVIDAKPPALKQMIDVFERVGGPCSPSSAFPPTRSRTTASSTSTRRSSLGKGIHARPRSRRKAAARRGAVEPRDHRTLPADARHLSRAARDRQRSDGRNSADQRPAQAPAAAEDLCVRDRRRPARHRQQARLPAGGGVFRAATRRT